MQILRGVPPEWPADIHRNGGDKYIPTFVTNFIDSRWKLDPEERGRMSEIVDEMRFMMMQFMMMHPRRR